MSKKVDAVEPLKNIYLEVRFLDIQRIEVNLNVGLRSVFW